MSRHREVWNRSRDLSRAAPGRETHVRCETDHKAERNHAEGRRIF